MMHSKMCGMNNPAGSSIPQGMLWQNDMAAMWASACSKIIVKLSSCLSSSYARLGNGGLKDRLTVSAERVRQEDWEGGDPARLRLRIGIGSLMSALPAAPARTFAKKVTM